MTDRLPLTFSADVDAAVRCMRSGGVILYPTDTVWGIGCDATNSESVRRVFEIKRRADAKALISLVGSVGMLERYVEEIPEVAFEIVELATNPVTVVYDHPVGLAGELLAEDGSAGIRLTQERYSRELCQRLHRPVVSTSANISGEPTPTTFRQIAKEIIDSVDYAASYRRDDQTVRRSSSVIKISSDCQVKILRP